ncbi:uncharacterized protein LOC105849349 isoform X2 [Hydra vulgaris]|uniref:uncharacterized protein LOC105849349 isoform X2 n=1 Tax=Hydra vulgaris TaxID=6087 RepID=UPI001F5EB507|nr:uncharacterized protein LOC105849349 isoform X2 [Hydra vulgaris]
MLINKLLKIFIIVFSMFIRGACKPEADVICEGNSKVITCPENSLIQIESAFYGRFNNETCPTEISSDLNPCNSSNVTAGVQKLCNGNNSCLIVSDNSKFGLDPCQRTRKYTIVNYTCFLQHSIFVPEIVNNYTSTILKDFYDEFVISFVILSNGNSTSSIIAILDNNRDVLKFDIFDGLLNIVTSNHIFQIKITTNTWSSIVVSQYFVNENSTYSITVAVDGTVEFYNDSIQPMIYSNSILYTFVDCCLKSSCDYASIKNLSVYSNTQVIWSDWSKWSQFKQSCIITRTRNCSNNQWVYCIGDSIENTSFCKDYVHIKNEFNPEKDTIIGILNILRKEYIVSFNVKPFEYKSGFKNILHITLGNNMNVYGDRNPGVWFLNDASGKLRIHTALSNDSRYYFDTSTKLITNKWSNIKIYQKLHNGSYWFFVDLNGNNIHAIQNLNATDFVNMKVYVSDPWFDAQNCSMSDLLIINADAVWEQWSTWSSCNHINGYRFMNRTRKCRLINATDFCIGNSTDIMECFDEQNFEVLWSQWSEWSLCDASCIITRTRNCSNYQFFNCSGNFTEVKLCELYQASWAQWNNWMSCNDSYKFVKRTRECNNLTTCDQCYGISSEVIESSAVWSQWSDWSRYNDFYGYFMNRTRECNILKYRTLLMEKETLLSKGKLVATSIKFYKEHVVYFEIKPTAFNQSFEKKNIISLTNGTDTCKRCQVLSVFINQDNGTLLILFDLNKTIFNITTKPIQQEHWSSIEVSQIFSERKYIFSIELNRQKIVSLTNQHAREFSNVTVFVSDTVNDVQTGYIRNLIIKNYNPDYVQTSNWSDFIASNGVTNKTVECMNMCSGYNLEFVFWTSWSSWSICNDTYGFKNRSRNCNVSNSINQCDGHNFDIMECYVIWSQWSIWSNCNGTYGFINRTRECNVSHSADQCNGRNIEVKECFGFWTSWSNWSICNDTYGFKNRSRSCNVSNSINQCDGLNFDIMECHVIWSQWSTWSSCNGTYGFVSKTRDCNVSHSEDQCNGRNIEVKECIEDGMWGKWENSKCSKTCGSGIVVYNRSCNNPRPSFNGKNCLGVSSYTEVCNEDIICPVNGNWSMWSSWSLCSQPCGGGVKSRFRSCSSPMPRFGGWDCIGSVKDLEYCTWQNCINVSLNMTVNFIDEVYTDWDFQLTKFSAKIHDAIAKIYRSQSVNKTFNVVIHSIKNRP